MTTDIRIYVADLAAYNAGFLHGVWIDAAQELDNIQDEVNAMLKASPVSDAEEYAIHDYEGFSGYSLDEYVSLESAHKIATFLSDFPEIGGGLMEYFSNLEDARKAAEESYIGCYKSLEEYAQEITEETTEIPQNLAYYIDYEAMARDMVLNGDVFTVEESYDKIHIFWTH